MASTVPVAWSLIYESSLRLTVFFKDIPKFFDTPSGNDRKLTVFIWSQRVNTPYPIIPNDSGSVTCDGFSESLFRFVHESNADAPISVTEAGITSSPEIFVHPRKANLGIALRASDSLRFVNPEQPSKAESPIVVTELGNVKDPVNPGQLEIAFTPIVFRLLDSVRMPLNPVQELKAI